MTARLLLAKLRLGEVLGEKCELALAAALLLWRGRGGGRSQQPLHAQLGGVLKRGVALVVELKAGVAALLLAELLLLARRLLAVLSALVGMLRVRDVEDVKVVRVTPRFTRELDAGAALAPAVGGAGDEVAVETGT